MVDVRLRPMTEEEFGRYVEHSVRSYGDQMSELGGVPEDEARDRAREDVARLLPQGLATPDNRLFVAESDGRDVGVLWVGLRDATDRRLAWVYDVEVHEEHRGRGLGAALMSAAEDVARDLGAARLGLNVFAGNTGARALYERLGYGVTSLQMAKPLG